MITDAKNDRLGINNSINCDILNKVENTLSEKMTLRNNRTAALWFRYICLIAVVRKFIRAERLGD